MNLPPQTLLQSRYEIRESVEQDPAGARYMGLDMRLGREVTIRTFPLPLPQAHEDYRVMDARTSRTVALHHPGIEVFLDMGYHQRLAFVVSEWHPSGDLGDRLRTGPLDGPAALAITRGVLKALAAAYRAGTPHGRLCPSAVLVDETGEVRLRDFSLSPTDRLPEGSPYRAPDGTDPSPAADLLACGVLLGDMLGGATVPEAAPILAGLRDPDPARRLAFALAFEQQRKPAAPIAIRWKPLKLAGLTALGLTVLVLATWAGHRWLGSADHLADNPEAVTAYRRARFSLARRTPQDLQKAELGFRECLRLDARDAHAAAGLAVTHALQGVHGVLPARDAEAKAQKAADRALALHPKDAEATAVLAYLAFRYQWDWNRADALFAEAVRLDPRNPLVRHWRGFYLSAAGRHREAVAELKEASRLDPVDLQILTNQGVAEVWSGDAGTGIATLQRVVDLDPRFGSAWDRLVRTLEAQGKIPEALAASRAMVKLGFVKAESVARMEAAFQRGGATGYLRERLHASGDAPSLASATYFALLGDRDRAFWAIEACVQNRDLFVVWIPGDTAFTSLHADPRFAAFLREIRHPGAH